MVWTNINSVRKVHIIKVFSKIIPIIKQFFLSSARHIANYEFPDTHMVIETFGCNHNSH